MIDLEKLDIVVHDDGDFFLTLKSFMDHGVGKLIGSPVQRRVSDAFPLENHGSFIRGFP
jgi:hypothetical protein